LRPTTLDALFRARAGHPEATWIAGGTDLMVEVNQRHRRFDALIAIGGVAELRRFAVTQEELVLGAGLTLSELEQHLRAHAAPALLSALWPLFSSRLIRNRATLGGNLGTASPIGDAAPCLLALDARLTLVSPRGERSLPLGDFFRGYRQTARADDELIMSVHIPLPSPAQQRFYKVSKRKLDDISTVAGAFALSLREGRIETLRVAYGGVAATPLYAHQLADIAQGRVWDDETLQLLLAALEPLATPLSDQRGSAAYRKAMMGRLLEKFWVETHEAPP
jgi:xanthine dehydrogenase small subunit